MDKEFVPPTADYELNSDDNQSDGVVKQGNEQDRLDMERLGQQQQLSRNFGFLAILGLNVVLSGTWFTWLTSLAFVFLNGGRGAATWTYVASWILSASTVLSLAEMASMAPIAGGQYHWVSIFAPRRLQRILSYITGWLCTLGWQCFYAAAVYATGNLILILASIENPSYVPTRWQETLITLMVAILATAFNAFAARRLNLFEIIMFIFFFIALLAILIPLWAVAPKASSKAVWTEFESFTGWHVGVACAIGQLTAGGAMIGLDAAVHMAEETRNASFVTPWAMVGTNILGPALGFAMCITINYCIQSVKEQIAFSTAVYPFISIFQVAVSSRAGAVGMTVPVVVLSFAAAVNALAAASRETWAFSRDGGLIASSVWAKVNVKAGTPVPINALILTNWFTVFSALLNLAGSEVYDTIISLATGAVCGSYVISIGSLILGRTFGKRRFPESRFKLGWAGLPLNIIAFFYNIQLIVFSYFPIFTPPTTATMNYGSPVFVGVIFLAASYYFVWGRRHYSGPVVHMRTE